MADILNIVETSAPPNSRAHLGLPVYFQLLSKLKQSERQLATHCALLLGQSTLSISNFVASLCIYIL